jgi:hypothetical protein
MPKRDCFKKKKEAGLIIKTFTGNRQGKKICKIATRQDVRHLVNLRSLLVYDTDVKCIAQITTKPRIIRFESPNTGDTEERWTAECHLGPFGEHTFSHVRVLSTPPYDEEQEVRVDLEVNRLQRGEADSASLSITVWS